jgi:hypothetical protein
MSKWQLASLLFTAQAKQVGICDTYGTTHCGFLSKIEREDGSGSSFNVTIRDEQGERKTFHVRTSD